MKEEICGIIFSKDRAMQLDAVLHSFFLHCQDAEKISLSVLYYTSTPQYEAQYTRLTEEYAPRNVSFIKESNFRQDLLNFLWQELSQGLSYWQRVRTRLAARLSLSYSTSGRYILFLVDDNLFVKDFSIRECAGQLALNPRILGFSLRLGKNTRWCYPKKSPQALPEFLELSQGILKYVWPGTDYDFSYPLEISSSLYRLDEMNILIRSLQFKNPNQLEGQMATHWRDYASRQPELLCFENSVTFCNPINIVQKVFDNLSGSKIEYSSASLANKFDAGERIYVYAYSGFSPNACHQEVDLKFMLNIN
jgi:hypothetical protein